MSEYPALREESTLKLHPLAGRSPFVVGRSPEAHLPVTDAACSRKHFQLLFQNGRWHLEPLSTGSPTFVDGAEVIERVEVPHDTELRAGDSIFRFLLRPDASRTKSAEHDPTALPSHSHHISRDVTVVASGRDDPYGDFGPITGAFPVTGTVLIGREKAKVQVPLPHSHVSRVHAQIQTAGGAMITDLRSANGTFVNGRRIYAPTPIRPGDRIDIGPYSLAFTGASLVPQSRADNVELVGRNLVRKVPDRVTGKEKILLDGVSLVVRPREFICILGPSGSGKSTLLSVLSARTPADGGRVLINGKDLYQNFDALKQDMVVVPQKDVLLDTLTVEQSLWYTAKLRLPTDTTTEEIRKGIDEILKSVSLTNHRSTPIRSLSGGQLKRASLANELLGKPTLILLDEVTSGLDEQTDRDMMALFRTLADTGKTAACITHTLANVEKFCDWIVVLTEGGKLAFVGPPPDALRYFNVSRLGDIYEQLATKPNTVWKEQFLASPYYKQFVSGRLRQEHDDITEPMPQPPVPVVEHAKSFVRQTGVLIQRNLQVLLGDRRALVMMALQAAIVALLLVILFGNLESIVNLPDRALRTKVLTFLLAISCFWFGCNNSAKELVKEKPIYLRERDFNLGVTSYYVSKFIVFTGISLAQSLAVWFFVLVFCNPANPFFGTSVFLLMLATAGTALGLAVSALSKTENVAVTAIPIVLLPQIILANAIAPLSGLAKFLGMTGVTSYWGFRGMSSLLPESTRLLSGIEEHSPLGAFVMIFVHIVGLMALGLGVLLVQARKHARLGVAVAAWIQQARNKWDQQR